MRFGRSSSIAAIAFLPAGEGPAVGLPAVSPVPPPAKPRAFEAEVAGVLRAEG